MNTVALTTKRRLRTLFTFIPLRLRAEHAVKRVSRTMIGGFALTVPPGVFHPRYFYSSRILLNAIETMDLAGKRVLDMGTGSGLLALGAARKGASVVAVDINPNAVRAAEENAVVNRLSGSITVIRSDLFDSLGEHRFDLIVWNPPFYPRDPESLTDAAWDAGMHYSAIERFAFAAADHLKDDGRCLLIFSSDMNIPYLARIFERAGFTSHRVAMRRRFLESFDVRSFSQRHEPVA